MSSIRIPLSRSERHGETAPVSRNPGGGLGSWRNDNRQHNEGHPSARGNNEQEVQQSTCNQHGARHQGQDQLEANLHDAPTIDLRRRQGWAVGEARTGGGGRGGWGIGSAPARATTAKVEALVGVDGGLVNGGGGRGERVGVAARAVEEAGAGWRLCPYHFIPPGLHIPITTIYDTRYGEIEEKQSELRKELHIRLGLPLDRPLLRISNALTFGGMEKRVKSTSRNVSGGIMSLIDGSYEYYHYLHGGIDDNGWGCAYRSLQTIVSWYRLQQYSSIDVPSHREIQQVLVEIGDKDPSFIGSREWIGAIELSFVLDKLLGVVRCESGLSRLLAQDLITKADNGFGRPTQRPGLQQVGLKPDQSVNFTWFGLDGSVSLCIVLLRQMASRPDGDPHGAACVDGLSTSTHCISSHLHTTAISALAAYSPSVSAWPDMVLSPMLHQSAWYIRSIKANTSSSRSPVPPSHPLPHAVQESLSARQGRGDAMRQRGREGTSSGSGGGGGESLGGGVLMRWATAEEAEAEQVAEEEEEAWAGGQAMSSWATEEEAGVGRWRRPGQQRRWVEEAGWGADKVSCKIINVRSGDELPEKCRELARHFETQGTPVMIGGGVLAYTLLGVDYNEASGDCAFLILDPHYTGTDDLKKIVSGGWCGWKKSVDSKGRSFFLKDKFYNLLLPQRPNMV
ncbi:hypothetical protein C2845_PM06G27970 [Panicum miliaceum]|uniref:Ufm1-specific protease n=1 Tax=Panicum miliaceum TaxID=4540 RepID=A0A3L6R9L9_PANMI|nr:hypothetical protein C2845_PM06G27970 [Panicum miliaceum]